MSPSLPNQSGPDSRQERRLTPAVQRVIEWHRQRREAASANAASRNAADAPHAGGSAQGA